MTPAEIMDGLAQKNRLLTSKNDEYKSLCKKRATTEKTYNVAYAAAVIRLRLDEQSVTLIPSLAKGDKVVSDLKLQLEICIGIEKACLESMKDIRIQIDSYRSLLAWLKAEMTAQ